MGAFNILVTDITCDNCQNTFEGKLQFKFGDTWQYVYKVGDKIKWEGNDIGKAAIRKVKVYGILEDNTCLKCGKKVGLCEFDIIIENDIIKGVEKMKDIRDYYPQDGNYQIIEE